MQEQPSKTSKTGHFGVLRSKSSHCCMNCEKITQPDCQEEQQRMTKYKCFQSRLMVTIIFPYELLEPIGKDTKKYLSTVHRHLVLEQVT